MTTRRYAALKREARKLKPIANENPTVRGVILNEMRKIAKVDPYAELARYAIAQGYTEAEYVALINEAAHRFVFSEVVSNKLHNAYRDTKRGQVHAE